MTPDHLTIALILTCAAYIFSFDHLGRYRHYICGGLILLSIGIVISLSFREGSAYTEPAIIAMLLLLAHGAWELCRWLLQEGRFHARSRKRAQLPARRHKKATILCSLSRDEIIDHFRQLAQVDELAVVKASINFLAWNNKSDYIIQIHLTAEGWIALFWVPADFELRDKEVKAACKQAGLPCSRHLLGMRAQGIATCREGQITISPADMLVHFDEFLHTVLAPHEEFISWLSDQSK